MSTDYEFSRVYAQGWNAALKLTPQQQVLLDTQGVAALNPYVATGREHDRWAEGFGRALGSLPRAPMRGFGTAGRRENSA